MEILGYPTFVLMREARSPAVSAPKKAAAAGGKPARSTSSRRKVLDSAPMKAAAAASGTGLLNMTEKPNTHRSLPEAGTGSSVLPKAPEAGNPQASDEGAVPSARQRQQPPLQQ